MLVKMPRKLDEKTFRVLDDSWDLQKSTDKGRLSFSHRDIKFMGNCLMFTVPHVNHSLNFLIPDTVLNTQSGDELHQLLISLSDIYIYAIMNSQICYNE